MGIGPAQLHQLGMRSLFRDPSVLQDHDPLGAAYRREAVRDQDDSQSGGEFHESVVDLGFGAHIEVGGRLVEDQDARAAFHREERAGQGDALPLAPREIHAVHILPREHRVPAAWQRLDQFQRPCLACRLPQAVEVVGLRGVA